MAKEHQIMRKVLILAAFVASAQLAGILGTFFTFEAIPTWYAALNRPSFAPPNWLFGPVWTILYTLMGISAFLLWRKRHHLTHAARALKWYWIQLALNAIWSPIFFGWKRLDIALIVIVLMWLAIVKTMWEARKADAWATALLIPYLAWVSFATILNYFFWQLN